ncbi:reverse transcriptase domain-containing protein [Tanacetum coccineum]
MIQPWQRVARQRITQSFSPDPKISFPAIGEEEGTEGPMIIEAKIRGHFIYRMYVDGRIITILTTLLKSSKIIPIECAAVSGPERQPSSVKQIVEERIKVAINPKYPEQTIMIGSTLSDEGQNKLCDLLQRILDVFAWKPADMTGIPRNIAEHQLNVREGYAYKGYHEIKMAKEDEEKTAFITSQGIFCYSKMPFGLRNAGATYQRLVDKSFHKQIGRNLEDMQKLNGKLASLNMFLAKSAEKSLPFFKILKKCTKKSDFYWTEEAESMFKQMKHLIAKLPMLTAPEEKEELIVYLAPAKKVGSRSELHINGKIGLGTGTCQQASEKILPSTPDYSGHGLTHKAYFIVEHPEEDSLDTLMEVEEELLEPWILFTDGSTCADGSGAGLILTNPEGTKFTYALRFGFEATNNMAEYEALIA